VVVLVCLLCFRLLLECSWFATLATIDLDSFCDLFFLNIYNVFGDGKFVNIFVLCEDNKRW
jgi:hypothetical protein